MSATAILLLCLAVTGSVTLAAVAVTTPWRALPPVPGGRARPDPGRDFTPAQIASGKAYARAIRAPAYASAAVTLAVTLLLGFTPAGARVVAAAGDLAGGGWAARAALGTVALLLAGRLATLPLAARAEAARRRFGVSVRAWPVWWADLAKGFGMSAALSAGVVVALYALLRALPRAGWPVAAAGAGLLVVVLAFVFPLVVEPAFNRFRPMEDGPLRDALADLARRAGVPVRDVLVADASRRTTSLNAYVSGLGPSRRVVVHDTTLARAEPREIELVAAHELGHAARHDVLHGTLVGAAGAAAATCLAGLLVTRPALLDAAGAPAADDPRSLALLFAVVTVIGAAGGPAQALVSRRLEARADAHALDLTGDPAAFTAMMRRLAVANRADVTPGRIVRALFATHPPAPERTALARDWARLHGVAEPAPREDDAPPATASDGG